MLQENLKKLRDSIYRRHKEMEKMGKELGRRAQILYFHVHVMLLINCASTGSLSGLVSSL